MLNHEVAGVEGGIKPGLPMKKRKKKKKNSKALSSRHEEGQEAVLRSGHRSISFCYFIISLCTINDLSPVLWETDANQWECLDLA